VSGGQELANVTAYRLCDMSKNTLIGDAGGFSFRGMMGNNFIITLSIGGECLFS
jgi:hypothetical protein